VPACPTRRRDLGCLSFSFLIATLAACTPTATLPPSPWPDAMLKEHRHNVRFAAASAELSASEAAELEAFLGDLPQHQRLSILVLGHVGGASDPALSSRRMRHVAELVTASGRGEPAMASLDEPRPAGRTVNGRAVADDHRVEIRVSFYQARLPACPDWSRPPEGNARNLPLSNLSCANAVNLGLMVADPLDLVHGRELAPADGIREAEAIARYRADKVKQLEADILQP
jgi:pilus assembly protein CpaD